MTDLVIYSGRGRTVVYRRTPNRPHPVAANTLAIFYSGVCQSREEAFRQALDYVQRERGEKDQETP